MENSIGAGFMAVFAVSGSIVLLSLQVHKRLLSNFMKKMEFELGLGKCQQKKVRFVTEIVDKKEGEKKVVSRPVLTIAGSEGVESVDRTWEKTMPLNWQVLYKGILDYRKSANVWIQPASEMFA